MLNPRTTALRAILTTLHEHNIKSRLGVNEQDELIIEANLGEEARLSLDEALNRALDEQHEPNGG